MEILKIAVYIPKEFSQRMMDSVNDVIHPVYPNYDRTFSTTEVTGTWRPLEGSSPYKGETGKIETADELKIEFIIRKEDLTAVIRVILEVHPYEEPAIDVIEMIDWHSMV